MKTRTDIPEIELIEKSRNGDSAAFSILINNYRRQLLGYLWKLCGNKDTTEDLFQDTLIKVWRGIKKYNERNKFSSWLFSIAHNTAMDNLRKNRVREAVVYTDKFYDGKTNGDPHGEVVADELKRLIENAVSTLPQNQKRVFLLRQHCKMTFKEIAELLDEPLNTVLSHMNYAVKKIKKALRQANAI
jgi:RNA polymerase sigma-70 factor (ECF subfamily)